MRNENLVANFYSNSSRRRLRSIAFAPLRLSSFTHLQVLGTVPSESGYAIADGVLRILPSFWPIFLGGAPPSRRQKEIMEALGKKRADLLVKVTQKLPVIMTWEVKSLSVAPEGVMTAIMDLTNSSTFPWATCHEVNCGHQDSTGRPHYLLVDATVTPWTTPSNAS
jgi:hypothetical protein